MRFLPLQTRRCADCAQSQKAERQRRKPAAGHARAPRRAEGRCPEHLVWVRSLLCAIGWECAGVMHAHHHRIGTGGGTGKKPGDRWAIPLCAKHHAEGHNTGWRSFEAKYSVDLRAIAEHLTVISPYLNPAT